MPNEVPTEAEKREAFKYPNGWIYRIDDAYAPDDDVPPDKIIGAWKVNERGEIVGDFILNDKYRKADRY